MKNKTQKSKHIFSNLVSKNIRLSACLSFALVILVGVLLVYYFLPILLNYGPGTINTDFDKEFSSGLTYFFQYVLIYIALTIIGTIFILIQTRDFKNIKKYQENSKFDNEQKKKLEKIISKCMVLPQYIFLIVSFLPAICVLIVFLLLQFTSFADIKVVLVIFTVSLLAASLAYIFTKAIFKTVLTSLENLYKPKNYKISLTSSLMFQISSLVIVCIIYTFLLMYSNNMEDKANVLRKHYLNKVNSLVSMNKIQNTEELIEALNNMEYISTEDGAFIIDNNNNFINFNDEPISDFFIKNALELANKNDNCVYDYYGTEFQGIVIPISIGDENIKVVIRFELSNHYIASIFFNLSIIILYCAVCIYLFSNSITKEISSISNSMENISNSTNENLNQKLAITSNDEIGDLTSAFNDIQVLTTQYINQIENSQQVLLEQERLASLGQMIGGIAHNMKTPIMSIAGAAEGLTELIGEYIASISNPQVTKEDHKEIAKDMLDWVTKIKTHISYMSDIITTVKGQASQLSSNEYAEFTLYDLYKKVDILIKHEIKKALLTLDSNIKCDPSLTLHGDINNLIQVVINLISNSIQSYNGKPNETIYFIIDADDSNAYIPVSDNGCGMTNEIKEKLFKEMITTKGKNGTGLGLYVSYSTIKGKFGGNIEFKSELNKGTTFTITIPFSK